MYGLDCMLVGLKSFVVSSDYRVYMGSSMTFDHFGDCYCTCALIYWTVLSQYPLPDIDDIYNAFCGMTREIF
jgi:hypothetical protein